MSEIINKETSEEFWKDIVYTNGKLDEKKVMKELADFYFIIDEVPKVYCEITGGLLSKIMYKSEVVLAEFNERFLDKEITKEDVKDIIQSSKTLKELKEELKDYFEIEEL